MVNEIVKFDAPELQGIEQSKAQQIRSTFEPMAEMLTKFEEAFNGVVAESEKGVTQELTVKAKVLRKDIAKIRIQTEKVRKSQKEEYLRAGKAIDGVSNILKWAVSDKENKLKEIEGHFEIQEQKRLEELQRCRAEKLSAYVVDAHDRDLSKLADDEFDALLSIKKKEQDDRIAAEKKAEEERKERERIDNLRAQRDAELRLYYQFVPDTHPDFGEISDIEWGKFLTEMKSAKETHDKKQAEIAAENEKLRKEAEVRKAKEAKAKKEREAKEAKLKKEQEAQLAAERAEKERIQKEEKAKREKLEAELKAKREAEEKALEDAEERRQAELNKGDSEKVSDLIADLDELKSKYTFKSNKNHRMYEDVGVLIDKIIGHIKK